MKAEDARKLVTKTKKENKDKQAQKERAFKRKVAAIKRKVKQEFKNGEPGFTSVTEAIAERARSCNTSCKYEWSNFWRLEDASTELEHERAIAIRDTLKSELEKLGYNVEAHVRRASYSPVGSDPMISSPFDYYIVNLNIEW